MLWEATDNAASSHLLGLTAQLLLRLSGSSLPPRNVMLVLETPHEDGEAPGKADEAPCGVDVGMSVLRNTTFV